MLNAWCIYIYRGMLITSYKLTFRHFAPTNYAVFHSRVLKKENLWISFKTRGQYLPFGQKLDDCIDSNPFRGSICSASSTNCYYFGTTSPFLLSSYVCKRLIKRQNSQILRRPQDDIDFCGSFANI